MGFLSGLFGGGEKASTLDDNGMAVMGSEKMIIKVNGMEYLAKDPKSIKAWEDQMYQAQQAHSMPTIQSTDGSGVWHTYDSPQGQMEYVKADLQIRHGLTDAQATKAVKSIPEFKGPEPVKIFIKGTGKETEASQAAPAKAPTGEAKAATGKFAGKPVAAAK